MRWRTFRWTSQASTCSRPRANWPRDYPRIEVLPVCADFTQDFALPRSRRAATHAAVYFPGSTIGNFLPGRAAELLRRITRMCGTGGGLLIGIDLKKDVATIEAAYNDQLGVTAEFNLNLLRRINRELGADFDLDQFFHRARYNSELGRVEMYLVSRRAQTVTIGGETIEFEPGETICTEYSHKYTVDEFAAVAAAAGLTLRREWIGQKRAIRRLALRRVAERRIAQHCCISVALTGGRRTLLSRRRLERPSKTRFALESVGPPAFGVG